MSVKAMGWAYDQRVGDPVRKAVLLALANAANEDGECWPRVSKVAWMAEISERTARRSLRELEEAGLLIVEVRAREDGGRSSNLYRLPIAAAHVAPPGQPDRPPRSICPAPPDTAMAGAPRSTVAGPYKELNRKLEQSDEGCRTILDNPQEIEASDNQHRKPQTPTPPTPLPACVPADAWADYAADRKERKKPLSSRASLLAFKRLEELHQRGQDVRAVIEQTIARGWSSFHEVRADRNDAAPADESWKRNVL